MAESSNAREQWYFSADQLQNSPSRKCGIDADKELQYRQQTAYLIQEMGQHLRVSQLCINTAIVYMHRFYAFHSFTHFHRNGIAPASLFLAAKVEEQPRKLEHVIRIANMCLQSEEPTKDSYLEQAQDLVFNENVLLQTLGFDVAIDHPHTHVVKTCHLVKAGKDLAQTSYFMASNSLHLTTMCLQYKPTVVACFCIHLACKWSSWEIPNSTEGRPWFYYVDKSVTTDLLHQLTEEFILIYQKSPSRLKSKLNSIKALVQGPKPEESAQPLKGGGGNSTTGQQAHRSGSGGSGGSGGSHHHHHHHHHHSSKVPAGGQQATGQSQGKQSSSSSSSYNNQQSSSRPRGDGKHSSQSGAPVQQQQQQQPNSLHRSSAGGNGGNGSSGMHNSNNGSRPDGYKQSRPQMAPQQQQSTQAPSSSSSLSSNSKSGGNNNATNAGPQKYNQPPSYSSATAAAAMAENSNSNSSGKSNSPRPQQSGAGGASKQPLFLGNYGDGGKKSTISDDAFQFSIDDLRADTDSQDSNQMGMTAAAAAAKSQKLQSIFCPDWKEDYTSGNTEHAKMNLPILATGDSKAPMAMQQQQRMMQQQGSSGGGASGMLLPGSNTMRKQEKKPEHRLHSFGGSGSGPLGGGGSSTLPSNNSSITNSSSSSSGGGASASSRQHQQLPGKGMSSLSSVNTTTTTASSSSSASKRPYDEMMVGSGGDGRQEMGLSSGGQQQQPPDYLRDSKSRRSELDAMGPAGVGMGGGVTSNAYDPIRDRQKAPIEKDFNDYRDGAARQAQQQQSQPQLPISTGGGGSSGSMTGGVLPNSVSSAGPKFSHHNSIETNPDLVSSLLKESLNTEHTKPFTTLPATATAATAPNVSHVPMVAGAIGGGSVPAVPTSQLDLMAAAPLQPFQQMRTAAVVGLNGTAAADGGVLAGGTVGEPAVAGTEEDHYRHKSEKKKKKEKHKNKDKEKDRGSKEERKKHKKDKERNKERHSSTSHDDGSVVGPLKLKIPKMEPSVEGDGGMAGGSFKIKIPRNMEPLVPLKIKISKDKFMSKEGGGLGSEGGGMTATLDSGGAYHKKKDKEKGGSKRGDY